LNAKQKVTPPAQAPCQEDRVHRYEAALRIAMDTFQRYNAMVPIENLRMVLVAAGWIDVE
jgi:hypothetical protein